MKVEDLHTVEIVRHQRRQITLTVGGNYQVNINYSGDAWFTKDDATKAAALFRASHKMQEALQELAEVLKTEPLIHQTNPAIQKLYDALALSENTAEIFIGNDF